LARILQPLVKAGLLGARQAIEVTTGWVGPPESISAFEVIKAIVGPLFITSCVNVRYAYRERDGRIVRQSFDEQRHLGRAEMHKDLGTEPGLARHGPLTGRQEPALHKHGLVERTY
jgi:hypothetical protein